MNLKDRKRLAQILMLTKSSHEGEAINAMRKANALLDNQKLTWIDVLGINDPKLKAIPDDLGKLNEVLDSQKLSPKQRELMLSFKTFMKKHGYLTPKQWNVVNSIKDQINACV